MKYKVEGRKVANIVSIIAVVVILLSNIFSKPLSEWLFLRPNYEFKNQTEIHFISVGQGDAVAIKFDTGKVMLIDSGIEDYRQNLKYYLDHILLDKSKTIDYFLLTHIDADHSGNMKFLLDNYKVKTFYRPMVLATCEDPSSTNSSSLFDSIIKTASSKGVELIFNRAGVSLVEGNTILSWLSPIDIESKENLESNDYSPVIRLDYNGHSALFTGDISDDVEEELIDTYSPSTLDVDILKLAHHGSAYSNSPEFLDTTSPQFACVCVGKNTYGHPSNKVIERILQYDSVNNCKLYNNLYSTDDDGNVIFVLQNTIKVSTISDINKYSFFDYYWYTIIASVFVVAYAIKPYIVVFKKNRRFIKQNREFEENHRNSNS